MQWKLINNNIYLLFYINKKFEPYARIREYNYNYIKIKKYPIIV